MSGGSPSSPPPGRPVPSASTEEGPAGSHHSFQVEIDADLQDLVPGYLANKRKDLDTIREALEKGDFETAQRLGHSIAGSGGTYGFPGITRIARLLEQASRGHNGEAARQAVTELESYLKRVVIVYV